MFSHFPELNGIWEVDVLQKQARESYEQWDTKKYEGETDGEIFAICFRSEVIGIIGWFEYGDVLDTLRLRYYGIVPSKRGKGYGEEAMRLFLGHLSIAAPPQYCWISESVSINRKVAPRIIAHFKGMGFAEFDDQTAATRFA